MNGPEQPHRSPLVPELANASPDLLARSELAHRSTELIADVHGLPTVSVSHLLILAKDQNAQVRLGANRALRCIESIAREDSAVVQIVGEGGLYHYVEAVISFGASDNTYLALIEEAGLAPEEATALYALREDIAAQTDGVKPTFPLIFKALTSLGISLHEAAADTDAVMAAFDEAGYFVDHKGGAVFDRPKFHVSLGNVVLRPDIDTPRRAPESIEWIQRFKERQRGVNGDE